MALLCDVLYHVLCVVFYCSVDLHCDIIRVCALAQGKSTTPEPPKAVNYDEALKAGALPSSVTLSSLRLFVALNGGDATGLLETYGAEYISI